MFNQEVRFQKTMKLLPRCLSPDMLHVNLSCFGFGNFGTFSHRRDLV